MSIWWKIKGFLLWQEVHVRKPALLRACERASQCHGVFVLHRCRILSPLVQYFHGLFGAIGTRCVHTGLMLSHPRSPSISRDHMDMPLTIPASRFSRAGLMLLSSSEWGNSTESLPTGTHCLPPQSVHARSWPSQERSQRSGKGRRVLNASKGLHDASYYR